MSDAIVLSDGELLRRARIQAALDQASRFFYSLNTVLPEVIGKVPVEELVDRLALLHKINDLLKDCTKEINAVYGDLEKVIGILWTAIGSTEPIRASLATGTVDVKFVPKLPKKDTDDWRKLMEFLGSPNAVFTLHWPRFKEFLSERTAQGLPPPPGVKESYPEYHVTLRMKRNGQEKE
jgi:DNA-binding transcriptional ArsR family regulator